MTDLRLALLAAAVAAGLGVSAATAQGMDDMAPGMGPRALDFATADADGDGLLTPEELTGWAEARFAAADADADGALSAEEMADAASEAMAGRIAERTARMVERMDDDGDGLLQYSEIEARMPRPAMIFDRLDTDGDGAISSEEFAAVAEHRGGPGGMMQRGEGRGFGGWFGGHGEGRHGGEHRDRG